MKILSNIIDRIQKGFTLDDQESMISEMMLYEIFDYKSAEEMTIKIKKSYAQIT